MEQFVEFIINHWVLSTLFAVLLGLLIYTEMNRGGEAVSPQQAIQLINNEAGIVVDIREAKIFQKGHITDAVNIPLAALKDRIIELEKHKDKPVVVVCETGQNAGFAGRILKEAGFEKVVRLSGGMSGWRNESLPLIKS